MLGNSTEQYPKEGYRIKYCDVTKGAYITGEARDVSSNVLERLE